MHSASCLTLRAALAVLVLCPYVLGQPYPSLKSLPAGQGVWLGASYNLSLANVTEFASKAGLEPVIYDVFVDLPLTLGDIVALSQALEELTVLYAYAMITVQPYGGLQAVTAGSLAQLGALLTPYVQQGARVLIRFAHEMNGSWYPWGQQPGKYIAAFQLAAVILKSISCNVEMIWAPNTGLGYNWPAGLYAAKPGSQDFAMLDTNHDGVLNNADNMYQPYYPGDAAVDWVGMSAYYLGSPAAGNSYEPMNALPAPQQFASSLTGSGTGIDFYQQFAAARNKPLVGGPACTVEIVTETSAEFNTQMSGPLTNLQIKSAWWVQAFNAQGDTAAALDLPTHFPMLKIICWFDWLKAESLAGGALVDWRVMSSDDPQVIAAFRMQMAPALSGVEGATPFVKQLPDLAYADCSSPQELYLPDRMAI